MNHFHKIAGQLAPHQLDAVLLTGAANRFYATGFYSAGTDGAVLIAAGKVYYFTDSRYIEAAAQQIYGAEMREVRPGHGYTALISEAIAEQSISRLGFEDASMTVADYELYRSALSCDLVPASGWFQSLRSIKDSWELEQIIAAQRIAEKALDRILEEIHPGITEKEVAARLQYLMLHNGAEQMSFDPIVVSGPNGSLPHGVPSERVIQKGDFVTMDFGCVKNGYCSDMTRTVAVGFATEKMRKIYDVVLAAQAAGIAAAAAGIPGKAIDSAARAVIEAAGYGTYFGHSFGHGVGVEVHESPNVSARNEQPLPAGAVVSAEPGIYLPGELGIRIEDMLVIQETGCMDITQAPKELLIL